MGPPVETALNNNLAQGSKRVFSRPVNKEEPITPDMICRICVQLAHEGSNLRPCLLGGKVTLLPG